MRSLVAKLRREITRPFRGNRPTSTVTLAAFNPRSCTVEPNGLALLKSLVQRSAQYPGPIIEIGTLLGVTTTHMALAKQPWQKIVTVDNYSWNPWALPPDAQHALAGQVLHYL